MTTDPFVLLATNALPTTRRLRAVDWYGDDLGRLLTPRHYSSAVDSISEGIELAADNDCFQGLDEPAFLAMLEALAPVAGELRFVTAPDVVYQTENGPRGDAEATLARFAEWGPRIRERGFRVALVLQDGMTVESLPWGEFDALFVGGSDEFKLGAEVREIAAVARRAGVWVHMGRVNSYKRARYAYEIGCSSIDGSGWARFKTAMRPRWARLVADIEAGSIRREEVAA
jgi:hypothetical protein